MFDDDRMSCCARAHEWVPAPFGGLRVAATPAGVCTVEFRVPPPGRAVRSAGPPPRGGVEDATAIASEAAAQLRHYLAGQRTTFDLPLDWNGVVSLRRQVLQVLARTVGFGATVTYQGLAERCGRPGAARVVGQIMGSNPLPVIVPCHRVVASGGELGGFGGGLETKRWLLEHEGSLPPRLPL